MNYDSKCQVIQQKDSFIKNLENNLKELQVESNNKQSDLMNQLQNEKSGKPNFYYNLAIHV